ncbi:MAG: hypothetical protein VR70_16250 [Rhodospirillaceae bacterium BRH_c57]|nr:MAG: hypothetical protein VR70_16250 [Rhodospirillaceae bacterium BRH_c57]
MDGCSEGTCFAPDTACALGNPNHRTCLRWKGGNEVPSAGPGDDEQVLLPWTGQTLGLADLSFITGRGKPLVVAIAGPESAGKTTVLASWYLLMGRGRLLGADAKFSGSYSLAGWEGIAASLCWGPGHPPSFPAHTSSRDARAPGLLHMTVRVSPERTRDLLFADAPGAWFQKWAVNADAPEAEGARWLARHADVFLIAADREALAGPKLGQARNSFQLLAKRIAAERRNRPVALLWTKGDVAVDPAMEAVIRSAVLEEMPDAEQFTTSVFSADGEGEAADGFVSVFQWLLHARRSGARGIREPGTTTDPLFLLGRR